MEGFEFRTAFNVMRLDGCGTMTVFKDREVREANELYVILFDNALVIVRVVHSGRLVFENIAWKLR